MKIFTVHAAPPGLSSMGEEERAIYYKCDNRMPGYSSSLFPSLWAEIDSNNKETFITVFLNMDPSYLKSFCNFLYSVAYGKNKNTERLHKYITAASDLLKLSQICDSSLPDCSLTTDFLEKDKKYQDRFINLLTEMPEDHLKILLECFSNGYKVKSFLDYFPKVKNEDHKDFVHFFSEINSKNIGDLVNILSLLGPEDRLDCVSSYHEICLKSKLCLKAINDDSRRNSDDILSCFFKLYPYMYKKNINVLINIIVALRDNLSQLEALVDICFEKDNNKEYINEYIESVENLKKRTEIHSISSLNNSSFIFFLHKNKAYQNHVIDLLRKIPKNYRAYYFNFLPDETEIKDFVALYSEVDKTKIENFANWLPKTNKEVRRDFTRLFQEVNSSNIKDLVKLLPVLEPEGRESCTLLYKKVCLDGEFNKSSKYNDKTNDEQTLSYFFELFQYIDKENRNAFANVFSNLGDNSSKKKNAACILVDFFNKKNNERQYINEQVVSIASHLLEHSDIFNHYFCDFCDFIPCLLHKNKAEQDQFFCLFRTIPKIYKSTLLSLRFRDEGAIESFCAWFPKIKKEDQKYFVESFEDNVNLKNIADFVESLPFLTPDAREELSQLYYSLSPMNKDDVSSHVDENNLHLKCPTETGYCHSRKYRDNRHEIFSYFFKILPYLYNTHNRNNFFNVFNSLHFESRDDFLKFIIKTYKEDKEKYQEEDKAAQRVNNYICSVSNLFDVLYHLIHKECNTKRFWDYRLNSSALIYFVQSDEAKQKEIICKLAETPENFREALFNELQPK